MLTITSILLHGESSPPLMFVVPEGTIMKIKVFLDLCYAIPAIEFLGVHVMILLFLSHFQS